MAQVRDEHTIEFIFGIKMINSLIIIFMSSGCCGVFFSAGVQDPSLDQVSAGLATTPIFVVLNLELQALKRYIGVCKTHQSGPLCVKFQQEPLLNLLVALLGVSLKFLTLATHPGCWQCNIEKSSTSMGGASWQLGVCKSRCHSDVLLSSHALWLLLQQVLGSNGTY